jgi:hypothetical protein
MLIATQNPITMSGRCASSPALNRRLAKLQLPSYTDAEMDAILCAKGMDAFHADLLIQAYVKQRQHALANRLTPPNFRDVLRVASQFLEQELVINPELDEETDVPADDFEFTGHADFLSSNGFFNTAPSDDEEPPAKRARTVFP